MHISSYLATFLLTLSVMVLAAKLPTQGDEVKFEDMYGNQVPGVVAGTNRRHELNIFPFAEEPYGDKPETQLAKGYFVVDPSKVDPHDIRKSGMSNDDLTNYLKKHWRQIKRLIPKQDDLGFEKGHEVRFHLVAGDPGINGVIAGENRFGDFKIFPFIDGVNNGQTSGLKKTFYVYRPTELDYVRPSGILIADLDAYLKEHPFQQVKPKSKRQDAVPHTTPPRRPAPRPIVSHPNSAQGHPSWYLPPQSPPTFQHSSTSPQRQRPAPNRLPTSPQTPSVYQNPFRHSSALPQGPHAPPIHQNPFAHSHALPLAQTPHAPPIHPHSSALPQTPHAPPRQNPVPHSPILPRPPSPDNLLWMKDPYDERWRNVPFNDPEIEALVRNAPRTGPRM